MSKIIAKSLKSPGVVGIIIGMDIFIVLLYLDLLGTVVFAISGLLAVHGKQLDLFGAVLIAMVTAIGGGTLRDLILGEPVFWVLNNLYIYLVIGTTFAVLLFARYRALPVQLILYFDALGLAVFTILGVNKALELGFSYPIAIITGVMTGVFGGIIRDVLVGEVPLIFRKEIYATASFFGGIIYVLMQSTSLPVEIPIIVAILFIFILRTWAVKFNKSLPVLDVHRD